MSDAASPEKKPKQKMTDYGSLECSAGDGLGFLPQALAPLGELALDLRWSWSHRADRLWHQLDPALWQATQNPYLILRNIPASRLAELAEDAEFLQLLQATTAERRAYLERPGWFDATAPQAALTSVAYFSMEFGLGDALPFYAGGLGILAGDYLKTASDLCLPLLGVGLLYHQGYFRQMLDASGWQHEIYQHYDASDLPLRPVLDPDGNWRHVTIELPSRLVALRLWEARIGKVRLYLLDSNTPTNEAADRAITSQLYGGSSELRLQQELALGIGGWRALMQLGVEVDVCHLNEGHAAFLVLERTRWLMQRHGLAFHAALGLARAGNLFTTHTPAAAAFDRFEPALMVAYCECYAHQLGIALDKLLALGRARPENSLEPFNMAHLALRGSLKVNAVSRLHAQTSKRLLQPLFPRWPTAQVPIDYVTNGVHMPSWDSKWADHIWTEAAGKQRWLGGVETLAVAIRQLDDAALWGFLLEERLDLIRVARERFALALSRKGGDAEQIEQARHCLDPNLIILGFARRFTAYKRPDLLLQDPQRLVRLLRHPRHPLQLIIAGKAHPRDREGKQLIQRWLAFMQLPGVAGRVVFLEDYDMNLARELVQGVDLWLNTPRRTQEACGTSGMKTLVNGGLNLSQLDGWWDEAYDARAGWALGTRAETGQAARTDAQDAQQLLDLLEFEILPLFYRRDTAGIPSEWVARVRTAMAELAPQYSSNRMLRDYLRDFYLPLAATYRRRGAGEGALARELAAWQQRIEDHWHGVHLGQQEIQPSPAGFRLRQQVYLGDLQPEDVAVQLYADAMGEEATQCIILSKEGAIAGAANGFVYGAQLVTTRPASDFTPRVVAWHAQAVLPLEAQRILWWDFGPGT